MFSLDNHSCRLQKTKEAARQTYKEYRLGSLPRRVCVLLAQRNQLLGEPLRFFGFGIGRRYRLVGDERGDEVAEESLSVRRVAAQMSIFYRRHGAVQGRRRERLRRASGPAEAWGASYGRRTGLRREKSILFLERF